MTPDVLCHLRSRVVVLCLLLWALQVPAQAGGKNDPPGTIVLPQAGSYRAPGILRLAGKLHGLPVKVENRQLNDEKITISKEFSKKPVDLAELRILLASQSFYLHTWDHPEHGELLVASRQADWKPENLRYKKVLLVATRQFDEAWIAVQNYVATLNAGLEPGSARMVTLADNRTGKILLWSPNRKWLQGALEAAEKSIADAEKARERLSSYKVLHRRAARLQEAVLKELPAEDRDRLHMVVAPGNHLLYRANQQLSARVLDSLIKLDKPPEKVR